MPSLSKKIDFALILRVRNANPNGDPLNGNRPRTDYSGLGEISDVCLKRKLRDRLMDRYKALPEDQRTGQTVLVQSDDRKLDEAKSLRERSDKVVGKEKDASVLATRACEFWIDVRSFGHLFAYASGKKNQDNTEGEDSLSKGIRGPVSIHSAFSKEPVSVTSTQITKSVNAEGDGSKRSSDTMGMKHRVDNGVYVTYGAMNPQLAERTGFSDADAETIKKVLPKLFENDASSARPEGSMEVMKLIWWKHNSKAGQYSSAKVHRSLEVNADGSYTLAPLAGLAPEEINGF